MSDEKLINTMIEAPVITGLVATGEVKAEETVNQPPDPAAIKAETDRLEVVRKKAEEDAHYWRKQKAEARAEYFKSRGETPPQAAKPPEDLGIGPEPKQENFDDYQKFLDAKIGFEVNKAKIQWDREQVRKNADVERQKKMETLQEKINLGFQEYPDFEEVALDNTVPITPLVMDILSDCDNPHKIAYYLGRNRAEAIQISRMTPIQAAKAIAKIEVEIAKAGIPPSANPKIPGAPPPIKPVGPSHSITKDPEKMTQREFEEWRKSQGARRF